METEVLIHIDDALDAAARGTLERDAAQTAGVLGARFCTGRDHLLLIAYDPAATRAGTVLKGIRGRGLRAQLVGL